MPDRHDGHYSLSGSILLSLIDPAQRILSLMRSLGSSIRLKTTLLQRLFARGSCNGELGLGNRMAG